MKIIVERHWKIEYEDAVERGIDCFEVRENETVSGLADRLSLTKRFGGTEYLLLRAITDQLNL